LAGQIQGGQEIPPLAWGPHFLIGLPSRGVNGNPECLDSVLDLQLRPVARQQQAVGEEEDLALAEVFGLQ
jgi:hypothetical protein